MTASYCGLDLCSMLYCMMEQELQQNKKNDLSQTTFACTILLRTLGLFFLAAPVLVAPGRSTDHTNRCKSRYSKTEDTEYSTMFMSTTRLD